MNLLNFNAMYMCLCTCVCCTTLLCSDGQVHGCIVACVHFIHELTYDVGKLIHSHDYRFTWDSVINPRHMHSKGYSSSVCTCLSATMLVVT